MEINDLGLVTVFVLLNLQTGKYLSNDMYGKLWVSDIEDAAVYESREELREELFPKIEYGVHNPFTTYVENTSCLYFEEKEIIRKIS